MTPVTTGPVGELCAAAATGGDGPRGVVFLGCGAAGVDAAIGANGGRVLTIDCAKGGLDSLAPLRPVVETLLPELRERAPHLVGRYAPELAVLHPGLEAEFALPERRLLWRLANTPSERRSHRESEMLFRTVNGLAALLHEWWATEAGVLVLRWDGLHAADASTLLAFRRITRWATHAGSRVVCVATAEPGGVPEAESPPDPEGCFDWAGWHRHITDEAIEQSLAVLVDGAGGDSRDTRPVAAATGPTQVADAVALLATDPEKGAALAVRAMGTAAFMLNYEALLFLAGHVVAVVGGDGPFDDERFAAEWAASDPGFYFAALEYAVVRPDCRADVLAAAWRAAGFANSCLGDHEASLRCYEHLLAVSETPERRARARMYLGLISGKRLRRLDDAERHLLAGAAEVEGRTDEPALLERCWLLNVRALMAFQRRDVKRAMVLVREAREVMRPLHSSEATHLKVNLVSNVSVLLEKTGRAERAAELWQQFAAFLGPANELFAKHYYYREGGLRLLADRADDALKSFVDSYEQCVAIDDPFHAAIVARAAGYTAHRLGRHEEALDWYLKAVEDSLACGDHEAVPADRANAVFVAAGLDKTGKTLSFTEDPVQPVPPRTKLNRPFSLVNLYGLDEAD